MNEIIEESQEKNDENSYHSSEELMAPALPLFGEFEDKEDASSNTFKAYEFLQKGLSFEFPLIFKGFSFGFFR